MRGRCCSPMCGRIIPTVPGMAACCIAHVNPRGEPCLDGLQERDNGLLTCTEWAIDMASTCTQANREDWQQANLDELEL